MKFADLFGAAHDLGADLLATGHYVIARDDGRGGQALYRAADRTATRATSCSPPPATSSAACAFRSAACRSRRFASLRAAMA